MSSLAEEYSKEQERLRELISQYKEIGQAGQFALYRLNDILSRSEIAAAEQDTVTMIRCFKEMQGCQ